MFAVDDIDDTVARLRPTAPNSSARWRSTRTATGSPTCTAPGIILALAEQMS
jgi:hypothetical protein